MTRVKIPKDQKVVQFFVYLPPKLAASVKQYCQQNEIRENDYIRELIRADQARLANQENL